MIEAHLSKRARLSQHVLGRRGALALAALIPAGLTLPCIGAACASATAAPLTDAQAARLVAIGGAVTETVYALGMGEKLIAVDSTSLYPPAALREKKNVGYMRALSAEGVLSVEPSAILMIEGSGPPPVVELLRRSPVPVVSVDGAPTAAAVSGRVRFLGGMLGVPARGEALARHIDDQFSALATARAKARHVRAMFILSMRSGRPLAAGRDTAADAIIALAGAENILSGFTGYKALTDEAVIEAAPDIVLMMEGGDASATPDAVLAMPAFRATPAGRARAVVAIDGETLLGFGPRTPETAMALLQRFSALPTTQ